MAGLVAADLEQPFRTDHLTARQRSNYKAARYNWQVFSATRRAAIALRTALVAA